ncbi:putative F0F1-ATPase subunit [Longilinea arvoryzae]|uniref:Putative F0F1-ATPase subunit n=1 Tax=Longilinea arvoryzae TaxID=360412 RepID=A0A0S7BNE4_9CHLR|nr:AtpZ/AtpI family protein [Longilinea arvoryzae]GAP15274.1 putative F0F1-ATPase subunit [Longilinea arvoryzae]
MEPGTPNEQNSKKQWIINLTIAGLVGQVGCLTLVIILGAVFGGLWLDAHFNSKPAFTIGLLIVSIPVSVVVMLLVVRSAISKIKNIPTQTKKPEETSIGKDS